MRNNFVQKTKLGKREKVEITFCAFFVRYLKLQSQRQTPSSQEHEMSRAQLGRSN